MRSGDIDVNIDGQEALQFSRCLLGTIVSEKVDYKPRGTKFTDFLLD